ncbi:hypothetical protein RB195_020626 [Necator americanus]|uniref:Uncharacterized protein n=1 Tax=Necator americanus TaxID=51031 RepID=A0ABR1CKK0_NECAM
MRRLRIHGSPCHVEGNGSTILLRIRMNDDLSVDRESNESTDVSVNFKSRGVDREFRKIERCSNRRRALFLIRLNIADILH